MHGFGTNGGWRKMRILIFGKNVFGNVLWSKFSYHLVFYIFKNINFCFYISTASIVINNVLT